MSSSFLRKVKKAGRTATARTIVASKRTARWYKANRASPASTKRRATERKALKRNYHKALKKLI